jgi:hypothetical protein
MQPRGPVGRDRSLSGFIYSPWVSRGCHRLTPASARAAKIATFAGPGMTLVGSGQGGGSKLPLLMPRLPDPPTFRQSYRARMTGV